MLTEEAHEAHGSIASVPLKADVGQPEARDNQSKDCRQPEGESDCANDMFVDRLMGHRPCQDGQHDCNGEQDNDDRGQNGNGHFLNFLRRAHTNFVMKTSYHIKSYLSRMTRCSIWGVRGRSCSLDDGGMPYFQPTGQRHELE